MYVLLNMYAGKYSPSTGATSPSTCLVCAAGESQIITYIGSQFCWVTFCVTRLRVLFHIHIHIHIRSTCFHIRLFRLFYSPPINKLSMCSVFSLLVLSMYVCILANAKHPLCLHCTLTRLCIDPRYACSCRRM